MLFPVPERLAEKFDSSTGDAVADEKRGGLALIAQQNAPPLLHERKHLLKISGSPGNGSREGSFRRRRKRPAGAAIHRQPIVRCQGAK